MWVCQCNFQNRKSGHSKWCRFFKKQYHRWLRHQAVNEDSYGGRVRKKYTGGWMY